MAGGFHTNYKVSGICADRIQYRKQLAESVGVIFEVKCLVNGAATIIYHDGLVAAFCYVNTNNVHRETSPNDSDNPQLLTGRTLLQYERKALVLPHPANQHIPVRLRTQTAFSGPETVSVPQ